jgi:D-alanine transaminase
VHIIKDGILRTAPTDQYILPGIARANLIAACKKVGIPVLETAFTLDDLFSADEVLVSSSTAFCVEAEMIDGKPIGCRSPHLVKAIQDEVLRQFIEATN